MDLFEIHFFREVIYSLAVKLSDEWEISSHSVFHIWLKFGSSVDPIQSITFYMQHKTFKYNHSYLCQKF